VVQVVQEGQVVLEGRVVLGGQVVLEGLLVPGVRADLKAAHLNPITNLKL